jgi:protein-disulfide isomerase
VGCAAVLWVVLQYARDGEGGTTTTAGRTAQAGDARDSANREVVQGPWGVPWGGGEGTAGGPDAKLDPDALPYRGGDDPLVAIVEFGDYECEFTRKVERTLARLLGRFGGDVRVVFVHNPLPIHDHARLAARAAEAARRQGKFGEMHERLLEAAGNVDEAAVVRMAQDLGLDAARFRADLDGSAKDTVAGMTAFSKKHGLTGTPHFVIGGRVVEGARPEEVFAKVIEAALEDARGRLAAGKSRRDVYGESLAFLDGG